MKNVNKTNINEIFEYDINNNDFIINIIDNLVNGNYVESFYISSIDFKNSNDEDEKNEILDYLEIEIFLILENEVEALEFYYNNIEHFKGEIIKSISVLEV